MSKKEVYYGDYLGLDKILNAQELESVKAGVDGHDEMLFIIIHQSYELWFKQILYELGSIEKIFSKNEINDNTPDLYTIVHRLRRITSILRILVDQITIMETMTPLDFLDFRDLLRPASGFQSYQFKQLEAALGLKLEHRHGRNYYLSALRKNHIDDIQKVEDGNSVSELVNGWLERMPFFKDPLYWLNYNKEVIRQEGKHIFWMDYKDIYVHSLTQGETSISENFDDIFFNKKSEFHKLFTPKAKRNALFIMLYRDYPLLQLPYELLNCLNEVDELMANWRYRHINMVARIIGMRVGTGGSSGKDYLKESADKHYIFKELTGLVSFLIERRKLPKLTKELEMKLGFERD